MTILKSNSGKMLEYLTIELQSGWDVNDLADALLVDKWTVEEIEKLSTYINNRVLGVYGGTNINTQKQAVAQGTDIIVATPGRLYDLALSNVLKLKSIQKLVIDEVDIMLDLGFRFQLLNIFDLLPKRRQNIIELKLLDLYGIVLLPGPEFSASSPGTRPSRH